MIVDNKNRLLPKIIRSAIYAIQVLSLAACAQASNLGLLDCSSPDGQNADLDKHVLVNQPTNIDNVIVIVNVDGSITVTNPSNTSQVSNTTENQLAFRTSTGTYTTTVSLDFPNSTATPAPDQATTPTNSTTEQPATATLHIQASCK